MKRVLVGLGLMVIATGASAEVYFCSDKDAVGFAGQQNYEFTRFKPRRFKVDIDFVKQTITSNDIYFSNSISKECVRWEDEMYCIAATGSAFSINKRTGEFSRSGMMVADLPVRDDLILQFGTCEKF